MLLTFVLLGFGFIHSLLVLYTPIWNSKRIQPKKHKAGLLWKRLPLIGLNIFLLLLVYLFGLYFGYSFFNHGVQPSWIVIGFQVLLIVFFDDIYFYFYHKFLHENKWALHHIHGIHHQAIMPFPLEYMYVHPAEWFLGSFGPFLAVALSAVLGNPISEAAFFIYIIVRNLHESDIHSGIKSRFFKAVPVFAPAEHHDLHHSRPFGNYASTFLIWDKVFGTEVKPEEVKKVKK
jgi:methylsterol monooxygenase